MDTFRKQPREVQIVFAGAVLYLIFSFLDWQQVSFAGVSAGLSEWHGVGVVAGLLAIAVLLWEGARLLGVMPQLGPITPGLGSIGLVLLLLLFTVITFLTHNEDRHWPSWIGLILSIVITVAAFGRARGEGVDVREFGAIASELGASAKAKSGGGEAPAAGSADESESQPTSGQAQGDT
jgi:hypothetical protein